MTSLQTVGRVALRSAAQALALALACAAALAAGADDAQTEPERITAERRVVEARFAAAQLECQQHFVVTDCLDGARAARRKALDRLQRRQLVLDDARRRERADQRVQAQRARARELEAEAAAALQGLPRTAAAASPPGAAASGLPAGRRPRSSRPNAADAAAAARTQHQHEAAYLVRRQAARDHQQALARRNAQQDAQRAAASGLPLPAASAAAR